MNFLARCAAVAAGGLATFGLIGCGNGGTDDALELPEPEIDGVDLELVSLVEDPPRIGSTVYFNIIIRNLGNETISTPWRFRLLGNGAQGDTFNEALIEDDLGPGETLRLNEVPLSLVSAGQTDWTITAVADFDNDITEVDEGNNTKQIIVQVNTGAIGIVGDG